MLSRGGLGTALKALARRAPIRVELEVRVGERPPEAVEVGVYYVVSEALTNAAKHARGGTTISIELPLSAGPARERTAAATTAAR